MENNKTYITMVLNTKRRQVENYYKYSPVITPDIQKEIDKLLVEIKDLEKRLKKLEDR